MKLYGPLTGGKRLVVNLKDGTAIDGFLWDERRALIVLKGCTIHIPGEQPTPADGEIVIERENISYVQAI